MAAQLQRNNFRDGTHFYASSGGNAGLACVVAAKQLGYTATVVVPTTTKPLMIAKIKAAGASQVIQIGSVWKEADTYLQEVLLREDKNGVYVPPFDHPDIWEGHSTLVHEVKKQLAYKTVNRSSSYSPNAIICSVGGGGLFAGIMQGMDEVGWSDVPVVAVETKGAESFNASLTSGAMVTLPSITSLATSLGASRVAEKAFEYGLRSSVRSVVLSDAEATMGCWRLADDERMLVEPACGVNVALCYEGRLKQALGRKLSPASIVVIVLCGGSNVTLDMLSEWKKEYGCIEQDVHVNGELPSSLTAPNGSSH
jgi:L-serine/L-threonine ammonia-lyase